MPPRDGPPLRAGAPSRSSGARLAVLALAAGLGLLACGSPPPAGPNLVLVTLDTFRADLLEAYGGPPDLTPTLNRLAERATVFDRAVVSAGTTFPSHATMLTGLNPRAHGVRSNYARLAPEVATVAGTLGELGYRSGAFVSFGSMLSHGRLGRGFEARSDGQEASEPVRDGADTADLALEWVSGVRDDPAPLFLWYHNYDAHIPLRAGEDAKERLAALDYEGMLADGASTAEVTEHRSRILGSPTELEAFRTLYRGEARRADEALRGLLEGLERLGELERTVLFVIADHGEALGEHGWFGHGPVLWETILRVPFLIVDFRDPSPRRVGSTVGAVDLAATILELAGAGSPPGRGRSLRPALRGDRLEERTYFAEVEWRDVEGRPAWYDPEALAVYRDGFKLKRWHDQRTLFDLSEDAHAVRGLPLKTPSLESLHARLASTAEAYLAAEGAAQLPELDPETAETLRALGYVR